MLTNLIGRKGTPFLVKGKPLLLFTVSKNLQSNSILSFKIVDYKSSGINTIPLISITIGNFIYLVSLGN